MAGKKRVGAIPPELAQLRESIDNIDAALIYLLAERFRCTRRVGELKATTGLPAADPGRERVMIKRLKALAKDANLDPAFAEKFLNFIIAEVIRHHESIRNGGRPPRTRGRAQSSP
jgi:chorismate mutase